VADWWRTGGAPGGAPGGGRNRQKAFRTTTFRTPDTMSALLRRRPWAALGASWRAGIVLKFGENEHLWYTVCERKKPWHDQGLGCGAGRAPVFHADVFYYTNCKMSRARPSDAGSLCLAKGGLPMRTPVTARTEILRIRVSPSERLALERIAEHERRRPSEALRELIRSAAKGYGLWPPPEQAGREATT